VVIVSSKNICLNNIFFYNYQEKRINENVTAITTSVPLNMKIYRYSEYGYEISYPQNYIVVLSGGHSPVANPEYGMRLSLHSKDGIFTLDIDSVDKVKCMNKYKNYKEFIKYKLLNLKLDGEIIIKQKKNEIYKLEDDNYYFSFIENDEYIFQLSSNSKDLLKTIMLNFRFI
jgi:hypothetical protein